MIGKKWLIRAILTASREGMMDNYIVYMHINKTNGKKYIGITSRKPKSRWKNGQGYIKQKRFYSAIVSYGWDGFEHIVLEDNLSKADAERREEELIKQYKSNDLKYGYNIENGGIIHKLSKEQKEHLRQCNIGRKHTAETKNKMSESHKGLSSSWLTGRKQSEETIKKRFQNMHGKGNPKAHKIYQYDLDGNYLNEYDCMQDAVNKYNLSGSSHISQCCNNKRLKAHGFMWSYEYKNMKPYVRLWKGGIIHG